MNYSVSALESLNDWIAWVGRSVSTGGSGLERTYDFSYSVISRNKLNLILKSLKTCRKYSFFWLKSKESRINSYLQSIIFNIFHFLNGFSA